MVVDSTDFSNRPKPDGCRLKDTDRMNAIDIPQPTFFNARYNHVQVAFDFLQVIDLCSAVLVLRCVLWELRLEEKKGKKEVIYKGQKVNNHLSRSGQRSTSLSYFGGQMAKQKLWACFHCNIMPLGHQAPFIGVGKARLILGAIALARI